MSRPPVEHPYQRIDRQVDRIHALRGDVMRRGNEEAGAAMLAEQKRRQPKKRKNFDKLPDEVWDAIKAPLLAYYTPWLEAIERRLESLKTARFAAAQTVKPTLLPAGQLELIETSHGWSFHTQGWGMNKYARQALAALDDKLQTLGVTTEIRETVGPAMTGPGWAGHTCNDYELWANIPAWQGEAIDIQVTVEDVVRNCGRSCHPQVLMPMAYEHPAVKNWPENLDELKSEQPAHRRSRIDNAVGALHHDYANWQAFLDQCEVEGRHNGYTWYRLTNCHYIVDPGGFVHADIYGHHGQVLWERVLAGTFQGLKRVKESA